MKTVFLKTVGALFLLTLIACGGSGGDLTPEVLGFEPAIAQAGDNVTIFGNRFLYGGVPTVTIGGASCTINSTTDNKIAITLPVGVSAGQVLVETDLGTYNSPYNFTVGTLANVAEVEPNDNIKGLNATNAMGNRSVSGNLSTVGDLDHFRFDSMVHGQPYTLHLSPVVSTTIYVDGNAVTLNGNGDCVVSSMFGTILLRVTGGTGNYTATLTKNP